MTTRSVLVWPLKFGLVATVESDDHDRPLYIPPPIARGDHHERCGCQACRTVRVAKAP